MHGDFRQQIFWTIDFAYTKRVPKAKKVCNVFASILKAHTHIYTIPTMWIFVNWFILNKYFMDAENKRMFSNLNN